MSDPLERVGKLLALAADSDSEEARTAAHKAAKLIREHGFKLVDPSTHAPSSGEPSWVSQARAHSSQPAPEDVRRWHQSIDDILDGFDRQARSRSTSAPPGGWGAPGTTRGGWQHTQQGDIRGRGTAREQAERDMRDERERRERQTAADAERSTNRDKRTGYRVIASRFPGICGHCQEPYQAGTEVAWKRGGGPTYHVTCYQTMRRQTKAAERAERVRRERDER